MEERQPGLWGRSEDYLDGIEDMMLFISSFDLSDEKQRLRIGAALEKLDISINAIREHRFIEENGLECEELDHWIGRIHASDSAKGD